MGTPKSGGMVGNYSKTQLIEMLEHARVYLQAALSGLKNERLENDKVGAEWAVREIVAHLAAWEEEFFKEAKVVAAKTRPTFGYHIDPTDDWRAWNAQQVAMRADKGVGHIILELETLQTALIAWVKVLPEKKLQHEAEYPWGGTTTLSGMLAMAAGHKVEHAQRIRDWRTSKGF